MSFNVNPFGEIKNTTDRGMFIGNRGELKVERGELAGLTRWKTSSWIYCSIDPKFAPKPGDRPLKYTKLFFMDEPTALAAGHRPCGYCQVKRFEEFVTAWLAGNPEYGYTKADYLKIDRVLHGERKNVLREKVIYTDKLGNLRDGVMVTLDVATCESYLIQDGKLCKWSPTGYREAFSLDPSTPVQVLTPKSVVNAIIKGYIPII
jgi:hypothetical protein